MHNWVIQPTGWLIQLIIHILTLNQNSSSQGSDFNQVAFVCVPYVLLHDNYFHVQWHINTNHLSHKMHPVAQRNIWVILKLASTQKTSAIFSYFSWCTWTHTASINTQSPRHTTVDVWWCTILSVDVGPICPSKTRSQTTVQDPMAHHKGEQVDVLWSRDNYTFGKNRILEPLMYIHNMCNIHERVLVEIMGRQNSLRGEAFVWIIYFSCQQVW